MTETDNTGSRTIAGRLVVTAMFSLGIVATAFLWIYWTVRITPYMPLQEALEREFPDSSPRAEGGTIRKTGETVLKVVLRTDFDPRADTAASTASIAERLERTQALAAELADLPKFDVLALHLYQPRKEQGISQKTFFRRVETWAELDATKLIGWEPDPARETPSAAGPVGP
jgi:hypothetical protein